MRPTRIELATFGLKDRRSLPLVKAALTTELRAQPSDFKLTSVDLGLEGRTALVMGASRGLGRAIAASLAREGARVAIASRSRERIEEAAAGDRARRRPPFVADASDLERLAALPAEVEEALGPIDILVANTGGPPFGGALEHELEEWEARLPLAGPGAEGARRGRRPRHARARLGADRQRRLDLDPRADPRPQPLQLAPDGRRRLPQDARRARSPATGSPSTPSPPGASRPSGSPTRRARWRRPKRPPRSEVPAGRLGRPEEYGDLVAFLCSERAAYITGTVIPIDGGIGRAAF